MLQGFPLGVSADDILSKPVSLSTAPAMPRPSSSTLFNDEESLSDMATRLAPLEVLCTGWMSGLDIGDEGELFLLLFDNDLPKLGMDPSAEQLLVFLDKPPKTLLFASTLDNVCVFTRAMSALRTVSMNLLPAPEMVPLPHSEDDDDDEAANDLVSSAPKPPLAPVPALVLPLPPSLCPRKSFVLSFSSSHNECNKDVLVLNSNLANLWAL